MDQMSSEKKPREFGNPRISFWLLNGQEEEVKIVEPEVEYPLPEDARFIAEAGDTRVLEVRYHFHPTSRYPYCPCFWVKDGVDYVQSSGEPKVIEYGAPPTDDKSLVEPFTETIFDRDNLVVTVEMTRGKARVRIRVKDREKEGLEPLSPLR